MLSDFVKWIRRGEEKRILEEGIWGNWDYKVPTDKKEQMYDFYMMSLLLPPGIHMWLRPLDFGPDDPEAAKAAEDKDRAAQGLPPDPRIAGDAARTIEDKFYHALYEAANKLIPGLKKELLQVVEFSVAAELRHLWDKNESRHNPAGLIKRVEKEVGPKEAEMLKRYTLDLTGRSSNISKSILNIDREKMHPNLTNSNQEYKNSYRAMKSAGGTSAEWMKLAEWLFENTNWSSSYGGKAWAQIAHGWLGLHYAKHAGEAIAQIDHVYDLQHNTDTVFNKLQSYAKDGGYGWVKEALDHKRYLVSPHEMIEHVSPAMRELALIGIKLQTGKTWQQFEEEWPEILKKKAAIHNDVKHSLWKNNKDAYYNQYYSHSEPTPLTPEQFAAQHIKPSKHPWSVYHFSKQTPSDTYNATNKVPSFNDIQIGDQVALAWPAKTWYVVNAKSPAGGADTPNKPDSLTLSSMGETPYNMVKGYRPKSKAQFYTPPAAPATPAATHTPAYAYTPSTYTDATGYKLDPGDTVKKQFTISGKQGKVIELLPGNEVSVQWPNETKSYPASSLVLVSKYNTQPKEPEKPKAPEKATPAWPSSSKSWHEAPPSPAAKKPTFAAPTPEEKAANYKEAVNKILAGLPNVATILKYARVIKGLGGVLSVDKMLGVLEQSLGITLQPSERDLIKKAVQKENEIESYYQHRGHHKFPQGLTKDQAWASLQQKFPDPPHVKMDSDTVAAIEKAVLNRNNDEAVKLVKKATQYNTPAAIGYVVLKGLESYMSKKGT